jgi:hypothetical protein
VSGGGARAVPDARIVAVVTPDAARAVVPMIDATRPIDAEEAPDAEVKNGSGTGKATGTGTAHPTKIDAGVVNPPIDATAITATVHLRVSPPDSEVQIGGGSWTKPTGGRIEVTVPVDGVVVGVRNDACCEATERKLGLADAGEVSINLGLLPAQITPLCDRDVDVRIDDKVGKVGKVRLIPFGETTQTTKSIDVEFVDTVTKQLDTQQIKVKYAEKREVTCHFE